MRLAIFTGHPAFRKPLYVGAPIVEERVKKSYFKYMKQVFEQNRFTNDGPLVRKLESEIANIHRVKYCIAVSNATLGEILVLKALDIYGEVILPSFTFIATAHACLWQNIKTIFCDIRPDTLTIDVNKAEKLITKKTSAIIGVHLFGNTCDVKELEKISKRYNLKLIFDAAHAFNCSIGDTTIGRFGNAEILSFHATKFFSTFEGGAILTNDFKLDNQIRYLRNFGFKGYDNVGFLGINGKMSESSAAMGLASLEATRTRVKRLRKNYFLYREKFYSIPGINLVPIGKRGRSNYQYLPVLIDEKKFGVSRNTLYYILWKENIIARRYFYPGCHRMEPYNTLYPSSYRNLPVTEDISQRILCLPTNLPQPDKDIILITDIFRTIHGEVDKILKWEKIHL